MCKNRINVAVIDDGINEGYFKNIGSLSYNIEVTLEGDIRHRTGYDAYSISHGTICGSIIKKLSPNINLSSIKILDNKTQKSYRNQLIEALKWCVYNEVDVVNLSLGSSCFSDYVALKNTVAELYKEKIIIVASMNNKDIITYPASFGNVIGVKTCTSEKLGESEYLYIDTPLDGIDIYACSRYMLRTFKGEIYVSNSSNSYATPSITSKVVNLLGLYGKIELDEMKWHLGLDSKRMSKKCFPHFFRDIEWVENAIVFCVNCNNISLEKLKPCNINIEELVHINIDSIDNVFGKVYSCIMSEKYILNNVDTIIIIYDFKLEYTINDLESLYKQLEFLNKSIVLLPIEYKFLKLDLPFTEYKNRLVYPQAWLQNNETTNSFYNSSSIPIIGAFNLSRYINLDVISQISSSFKNDGFNCLVSTTESLGLLYGFRFLPFSAIDIKEGMLKRCFDNMINFYEANVLLTSANIQDLSKYTFYASCLDYDLKVFFVDEISNEILEILDDKSVVFLMSDNLAMHALPENKIFLLNGQGVQELYRFIQLFFGN